MVYDVQRENRHNNRLWVMKLILFSIILTPSLAIGSLPAIRLDQLIAAIYVFLSLGYTKRVKKTHAQFATLYVGFAIIIVSSIFVGSLMGIRAGVRDFFELYKIMVYLGVYLATVLIVKTEEDRRKVLDFMILCLLISVAISVQQYFNLMGLNARYVPLIAPIHYRSLVNNYPYPRVVGMAPNPNVYAFMVGIGVIVSWGIYIVSKDKRKLLLLFALLIGLLMTRSRTGFLFTAMGVIAFTFFYFKSNRVFQNGKIDKRMARTLMISICVLLVLGLLVFRFLPKELTWRLIAGFSIDADASFQARLVAWAEHLRYFQQSPILGIGPAKSIEYVRMHVDSDWVTLLKQYGLIGTTYVVFTFLFPLVGKGKSNFTSLYSAVLVACAVYMIPLPLYTNFQLMSLIMVVIGLFDSTANFRERV